MNWLQNGIRVKTSRPAHIYADANETRGALNSRKLISDRPPGLTGHHAQFSLKDNRVNLHHHTISLIRPTFSTFQPVSMVFLRFIKSAAQSYIWIHFKAQGFEPLHDLPVHIRHYFPLHRTQSVNKYIQWAFSSDAGIKLPHRTGSGIPGIGKKRKPFPGSLFIKLLESFPGNIDFASNLKPRRCFFPWHREWNTSYSLQILSDILPPVTISPSCPGDEQTINIG